MVSKRLEGVVRDPVTGAGVGAVAVSVKKVSDDSVVTSTTSDNASDVGYWSRTHDQVGYPGPVYEQFTSGATTKKRDGRVHGQLAGLVWSDDVPDVFALLGIGVSSGLAVSANGTSMAPAVSVGAALTKDGLPFVLEAASSVTLGAADATNPRIDRIVLRQTREGQADQGKILLTGIAGTPAASPTAPALAQNGSTWDLALAQVRVDAGVTTIAADKVTDERTMLVSATELSYVKGVTSAIQTQLDGAFTQIFAKQPLDAQLTDIAGLTPTDNAVIIGNGTNFVVESGATARTSLGLAIGTDVQAYAAILAAIAASGVAFANDYIVFDAEMQDAADTATNSSTVTNVTAIDEDVVLPAGTWSLWCIGFVNMRNTSGLTNDVKLTVDGTDSPIIGRAYPSSAASSPQVLIASKPGVAGGATVHVQIKYKAGTGGTAEAFACGVGTVAIRTG